MDRPLNLRVTTGSNRLASDLAASLAGEIRAGRLKPGDRLPTELEIVRQSGVSRTVVREAVSALRAEGLVVTRQGVGAFVTDDPGHGTFRIKPAEAASLEQVLEIIELRIGVEVEAAGLAAARALPPAIEAIAERHAVFVAEVRAGGLAIDADYEFHRAIYAATGNSYFLRFLSFLGQIVVPRQSVRSQFKGAGESQPYLMRVAAEHRRILDAIRAGKPDAARRAMRAHLEASRKRYSSFVARMRSEESADAVKGAPAA